MNVDVNGIFNLINKINQKKELRTAVEETSESIANQVALIKEQQEELKALCLADAEWAELSEEIKALSKELGEAMKHTSKALKQAQIEVKPAEVKAFFMKKVKDDEQVQKVIQAGAKFNVLKQQFSN